MLLSVLIVAVGLVSACSCSCVAPLGLESGAIKDDQISSSSSFEPHSVGAERGRLNTESGGGAWCPKSFVSSHSTDYLQIDLKEETVIGGILTQGRYAAGQGREFAEYFLLQYWSPGMDGFVSYRTVSGSSILQGNTDTSTQNRVVLEHPITAVKIRIVPYSEHMRTVCMRVELLGCTEPPILPLSVESNEGNRYLGILTGLLLTLSLLLMAVILVLLRRRTDLKRYPSLSSVSISGSVLERKWLEAEEPVYQEPGVQLESPALWTEYSTPISIIYSKPHCSIYEIYQSPDHFRDSLTDISYLEESSVDSSSTSSGTPRLPPVPNFDDPSATAIYANQEEWRSY